MTYSEKLKNPLWQKKRLDIFERDKFTCRECKRKDRTLNVHHCYYLKGHEPWEYPDEAFLTLCDPCHEERGSVEHDVKLEFARMLAKMSIEQISNLMPWILQAQEFELKDGAVILDSVWFDYRLRSGVLSLLGKAVSDPALRPHYEALTNEKPSWEEMF